MIGSPREGNLVGIDLGGMQYHAVNQLGDDKISSARAEEVLALADSEEKACKALGNIIVSTIPAMLNTGTA